MSTAQARWSAAAGVVWGKTDRDGDDWLPLVQHLEDSAAVGGALWDHWLPRSVCDAIAAWVGGDEASARSAVVWLAGIHDLGKASPGFAIKASYLPAHAHLVDSLEAQGLHCPVHVRGSSDKLPPHCRIGHFLLSQWLMRSFGASRRAADALASPVGAHHGVPPEAQDLRILMGSRWSGAADPNWAAVQEEILEGMARRTGAADYLSVWVANPPTKPVQALLSGIVVVADWLASDIRNFPYAVRGSAADRVARADLGRSLLGPWEPAGAVTDASDLLSRRFPSLPTGSIKTIQAAAHAQALAMTEPGLIVVEAPMGVGKTEAALLAAEVLAHRFGLGGVFIGLPTMATSDAMFSRVLEWTRHLESPDPPTVTLAHSKARLHEQYRGLLKKAWVREVNAAEGDVDSGLVTLWFQGRRKGILANLVIGTIDQALFGALKARHLALRHLGLAGKVVIIDEVHAADAYMRRYLTGVLEWLAAYGTPVILLSATLPPGQLDELTRAYAKGRGVGAVSPRLERTAYPQLTMQTTKRSQVAVPWDGEQVSVVVEGSTDPDVLIAELVRAVEDGACVVVIRNTVGRAQSTYAELRAALGRERVRLLHSRFVAADRASRETELLRLLGKPGPGVDRPHGLVVVGTQVLEQSLDIDADIMVTDHSPIDLLLQRMGRLHRHKRGEGQSARPDRVRQARLLVEMTPSTREPAAFESGAEHIYGRSALMRSALVLEPHLAGQPVVLPADIPTLVDTAYAPNLPPPAGWEADWTTSDAAAFTNDLTARGKADTFRLGGPAGYSLVDWLKGRSVEGEDIGGARAQVRDTEDSLEVLVVWRDDAGAVRLLPAVGPHGGADLGVVELSAPDDDLALSVLASSVRLPGFLTRGKAMDGVIRDLEIAGRGFMGWQQSRWLAGQLVLCLDQELTASVGGSALHYDPELGLVVTKGGGQG